MAIFNRIFSKNTFAASTKVYREIQVDAAVKEYLENQRIAAADARILLQRSEPLKFINLQETANFETDILRQTF